MIHFVARHTMGYAQLSSPESENYNSRQQIAIVRYEMKVRDFRQVKENEELPGVGLRVVIGPEDGAPNFVMRVFEVQPGSSTPWHSHDWEHEVFVLAGEGEVASSDGKTPIKANRVVFVAPNEMHQFVNSGFGILRFICVIPRMA